MLILVFLVESALSYTILTTCEDQSDCFSCTNTRSWSGECRWCEETSSCHVFGSAYDKCERCTDTQKVNICSITNPSECGRSATFNATEAHFGTLLSAVAYSDTPKACINKVFPPSDDIEIIEVIGRKCNFNFKYKECFAYIAVSHKRQKIFLAYRGTESTKQLIDQLLTTIVKGRVDSKIGGKINAYFSNANEQLYECVEKGVREAVTEYPYYEVMVVGHSLGGAVASLAVADLRYDEIVSSDRTTLYTFGMPRVGDQTYAKSHDKFLSQSYRVVHFRDLVNKLPPKNMGYFHHQMEIFYRAEMNVSSPYTVCYNYEDKTCSDGFWPSWYSIQYHKNYFGIAVGSYCDVATGRRFKRNNEQSKMSNLFTYDQCRRIKSKNIPINGAQTYNRKGRFEVLLLVLMIFCMRF